jgi:hypothetical protein
MGNKKARLEPEELKSATNWYQLQSKNPCFCLSFFLPNTLQNETFQTWVLMLSQVGVHYESGDEEKAQIHQMKLSPRGFLTEG